MHDVLRVCYVSSFDTERKSTEKSDGSKGSLRTWRSAIVLPPTFLFWIPSSRRNVSSCSSRTIEMNRLRSIDWSHENETRVSTSSTSKVKTFRRWFKNIQPHGAQRTGTLLCKQLQHGREKQWKALVAPIAERDDRERGASCSGNPSARFPTFACRITSQNSVLFVDGKYSNSCPSNFFPLAHKVATTTVVIGGLLDIHKNLQKVLMYWNIMISCISIDLQSSIILVGVSLTFQLFLKGSGALVYIDASDRMLPSVYNYIKAVCHHLTSLVVWSFVYQVYFLFTISLNGCWLFFHAMELISLVVLKRSWSIFVWKGFGRIRCVSLGRSGVPILGYFVCTAVHECLDFSIFVFCWIRCSLSAWDQRHPGRHQERLPERLPERYLETQPGRQPAR